MLDPRLVEAIEEYLRAEHAFHDAPSVANMEDHKIKRNYVMAVLLTIYNEQRKIEQPIEVKDDSDDLQ